MNKKDFATSLILYKYFYRDVLEEEIELELPFLLKLTWDELDDYRERLLIEKEYIQNYFNQHIDLETIKDGFTKIGVAYIEHNSFDVIDYQEMIVHYLFSIFLPGHTITLHFDTPTSGSLKLDKNIINFKV